MRSPERRDGGWEEEEERDEDDVKHVRERKSFTIHLNTFLLN